jgi:hypothetical protein
MEFHLLYAGNLIKSGSRPRAWEKHVIRKHFHVQLRRLWEIHPALQYYGGKTIHVDNEGYSTTSQPFLDKLAENYALSGIGMIPLVTEPNGLTCSLEIVLLRGSKPGTILEASGDIDNQV